MAAEYRVLGPLQVLLDGVALAVPAGRCRVLLATLLLRPGQVVPVDELVERVWDGAPPSTGRADKTLQMVVARLRRALGAANCVRTSRGGYRAAVDASELDLLRFRSLVASGDFAAATALWRGPMLSDVRSDALHRHDVPPVAEERLRALEHRIAADLDAGRAADVVAELRALTAEHPFREAFWSRLVLALAHSGQQAAALTAYRDVRALLSAELDHDQDPVEPGDALSGFLVALGVAPERVPTDLDAASALFRGVVAEKRVLVVLDNARDGDQVRPLLPGPSAGLVLITSRDHLAGLVAVRRLALGVLTPAESTALLVSRLGEDRVGVADDLVRWCGGLPLALAIVAARAAQSPELPLSALAAELADERTRLDTLDTGDVATSVRAVFQWSYQRLGAAAARLFRLLGVHPGRDVTVAAAASLTGWPVGETREHVRELVRANLLHEHLPGRFTCHDLLRVYAADLAAVQERPEDLGEAEARVLDHHLHTLIGINTTHCASSRPLPEEPETAPGTSPEVFETRGDAEDWFRAEEDVLRAVVARSGAKGRDRHTWQLVWTAFDLVDRFGLWRNWRWALESAREAAARDR
ncbi:BTAD domain-containing putative transcriptional regulator [Lentzea sp. NPDC060358]|uniref:AfsR/SARP family transcriptional regulator n=1 Tax=Lentzea sp. NPDC060358 TaxID=3347103 RepID=UPI003662C030